MGVKISVFDGAVPMNPCDIQLELKCDGCGDAAQTFRHDDGFMGCYHAAMNAGWKDTKRHDGERVFFGPCCSGKKT